MKQKEEIEKEPNLRGPEIEIRFNHSAPEEGEKTIDVFHIQNKDGQVLTNDFAIVEIYLPNIEKKQEEVGEENLTTVEKLALFLMHGEGGFNEKMLRRSQILHLFLEKIAELCNQQDNVIKFKE